MTQGHTWHIAPLVRSAYFVRLQCIVCVVALSGRFELNRSAADAFSRKLADASTICVVLFKVHSVVETASMDK